MPTGFLYSMKWCFPLGNTASEHRLSQCQLMWKEFSGHLCFSPKCCGCALPSVYHGLVFVDFTPSAGLVFRSRWLLGLLLVGLCTFQFCTLLSPMSQPWFESLSPDSNIAFGMPLSWAPALRPFCARVWATPLTLPIHPDPHLVSIVSASHCDSGTVSWPWCWT